MCTVLPSLFSSDKTKSLFTPWRPGLIKKSKYGRGACTDAIGSYLFQWNVLLKLDFNCSSSFALFSIDKVITRTQRFVSAIENIVAFVSLDNTHLSGQVKTRLISQLIKVISRVPQKLLKYFNDTIISTSFLPLAAVTPVIFCLDLNKALLSVAWKLAVAPEAVRAGSSLYYFHKPPDLFA